MAAMPLRRRSLVGLALVLSFLAGALAACSKGDGDEADGSSSAADNGVVRVASFEFTESRILAELYTQALVAADVPARRAGDLASREILEPALEQDVVDLVPEYTGSALEFLNKGAGRASSDAAANYALVKEAFASRGLVALAMAPAQDQNAVAVTKATGQRLGVAKISDLGPHARELVFGGPPECAERPFCLGGLQSLYGLRFKEVRVLDVAGPATVGALEGGEIDVALLFTTTPQVEPKGFVLLQDDLSLQPADNVVPVIRKEQLDRHGDAIVGALDAISAALTTDELRALNAQVDLEGRTPAEVAKAWLRAHSLLG
jgi:osmoprotectant transport system substrate-binding protein